MSVFSVPATFCFLKHAYWILPDIIRLWSVTAVATPHTNEQNLERYGTHEATSRKRTPRVTMRKALSSISSKTYSTSSSVGLPLAMSWKFLAVLTRDDKSDSRPFRVLRSPSCCLTKLASRVRHSDFSLTLVSTHVYLRRKCVSHLPVKIGPRRSDPASGPDSRNL